MVCIRIKGYRTIGLGIYHKYTQNEHHQGNYFFLVIIKYEFLTRIAALNDF